MSKVFIYCPKCGEITAEKPYVLEYDYDNYYEIVNISNVPHTVCTSCQHKFLSPMNFIDYSDIREKYREMGSSTYNCNWNFEVGEESEDVSGRIDFYQRYYKEKRKDCAALLAASKPPVQPKPNPPVQQQPKPSPPVQQQQRPPVQQRPKPPVQQQQRPPVQQQQRPPVQQQPKPNPPVQQQQGQLSEKEQVNNFVNGYIAEVKQRYQAEGRTPYSWVDAYEGYLVPCVPTPTPDICTSCGKLLEEDAFGFNLDPVNPKWFANLPVLHCYDCELDQVHQDYYRFCKMFSQQFPHYPWSYEPVNVQYLMSF